MLFVASSNRGMQRLGLLLVLCLYCAEACSQDCAAGAYLSNCTCQLCSAGSYSAQRNNASSCTSCADSAWKTSDAGSTACTVCAKPFTPAVVRMTSDYNFDAIPGVDVVFQLPAVPLQTVYGGWYMRVEIWHGIWLHFHGLHLTVVDYDVSVLPSGAIVNSVTYNTQSTFQGDGYVYERGTRTLTVSKRLRIDVLSQQHYVYNLSFVPNGDCVHCTDVSEIDLNGDLMRPLYANTHCIPPPPPPERPTPLDDVHKQCRVHFVAVLPANFTAEMQFLFKNAAVHVGPLAWGDPEYSTHFVTLLVTNSSSDSVSVDTTVNFDYCDQVTTWLQSFNYTTLSIQCGIRGIRLLNMSDVDIVLPTPVAQLPSSTTRSEVVVPQTTFSGSSYTLLEVGLIAGGALLFVVMACCFYCLRSSLFWEYVK